MKKLLYLLPFALIGCVSVDNHVTPEAIRAAKVSLPAISKGMSSVCFVRQSRFIGIAGKPDILYNGEIIGEIKNGSYFCQEFKPGEHVFTLKAPLSDDAFAPITTKAGERKYIEFSLDYKEFTFKEVPESYALIVVSLANSKNNQ